MIVDISYRNCKIIADLSDVDKLICEGNKLRKLPKKNILFSLKCGNNRFKSYKDFINIEHINEYYNKIKDFSYKNRPLCNENRYFY